MIRRMVRIFLILGFVNFRLAAKISYRLFPTNMSFQEALNDAMIREKWINSLILSKDERTILMTVLDPSFTPENDIDFHLFTRDNNNNNDESYILKLNDLENLRVSTFKPERMTKIIVHGWTDSANSYWVKDMRRNYLAAGDYNVIAIDWYAGSTKEYLVSARLARQVGEYLGNFLEYLRNVGNISYSDVHILGHSLGAHIAGYAGTSASGKIGRITGMDPARPGFEAPLFKGPKDRLDASDAKFVDVIHSCAGTVGFATAIGHADFYPNGGSFRQPGCSVIVSQYCSHGRSHQFMAESIAGAKEFVAVKCESWSDYKAGRCEGNMMATMGERINDVIRGIYFLETNPEAPFAKGILNIDSQT